MRELYIVSAAVREKEPGKETSARLEIIPGAVGSVTLHQIPPAPIREANNLIENLLKQAKRILTASTIRKK